VLGLAGLFLFRRIQAVGFDFGLFRATLSHTDPFWLAACVVLSMLSYYGRVFRWAVMLEPACARVSYWKLFTATAIGFTAIVLFGRAGELVRPYLIARNENVSFASQMGAWVLERMYDLLFILIMFGVAIAFVSRSHEHMGPTLTWVVTSGGWIMAGLGAGCILVLVVLHRHTEALERRLTSAVKALTFHHHERIAKVIRMGADGLRCVQSRSAVIRLFLWSAVEWVVILGIYRTIMLAFPGLAACSLADTLILLGFVSFGSIVQIPGIGGGVQIVVVLVLTELFQVSLEAATSFALVFWIFIFVAIVPIGLLLAFREGIRWRQLRAIAPETSSL